MAIAPEETAQTGLSAKDTVTLARKIAATAALGPPEAAHGAIIQVDSVLSELQERERAEPLSRGLLWDRMLAWTRDIAHRAASGPPEEARETLSAIGNMLKVLEQDLKPPALVGRALDFEVQQQVDAALIIDATLARVDEGIAEEKKAMADLLRSLRTTRIVA